MLLLFAGVAVKCRRRLEIGFLFYESEIEFHFGKNKPPNIKHYGFEKKLAKSVFVATFKYDFVL